MRVTCTAPIRLWVATQPNPTPCHQLSPQARARAEARTRLAGGRVRSPPLTCAYTELRWTGSVTYLNDNRGAQIPCLESENAALAVERTRMDAAATAPPPGARHTPIMSGYLPSPSRRTALRLMQERLKLHEFAVCLYIRRALDGLTPYQALKLIHARRAGLGQLPSPVGLGHAAWLAVGDRGKQLTTVVPHHGT